MSEEKRARVEEKESIVRRLFLQWEKSKDPMDPKTIVGHPTLNTQAGWTHKLISREKVIQAFEKRERYYHEAIFPHNPCRIYLDIDFKAPFDREECETKLFYLINNVKRIIYQYWGYKDGEGTNVDVMIMDGIRDDKYSVHVVFPNAWVESPHFLKILFREYRDIVDMNAYHSPGRETPSFLRFPYADKISARGDMIQKIVPGTACVPRDGPTEFDREWFLRGCVSVGMVDPPPEGDPQYLKIPESVLDDIQYSRVDGVVDARARAGAMAILDWFAKIQQCQISAQNIQFTKPPYNWHVYLNPGVFCFHRYNTRPDEGGHHISNSSMFKVSLVERIKAVGDGSKYEIEEVLVGEIRCLDDTCERSSYVLGQNLRDIFARGWNSVDTN